ncbi:MAG: FIST N-terminal domain-containing protein [Planctomycetota bacterium]
MTGPTEPAQDAADPSLDALGFGWGLGRAADPDEAAEMAAQQVRDTLGPGPEPDIMLAFVSRPLASSTPSITSRLTRLVEPRHTLAVSAEAVVAGAEEVEGLPGVAVLAGRLPGARCTAYTHDTLTLSPDEDEAADERTIASMGLDETARAVLIFPDPFSVPVSGLVTAASRVTRKAAQRHGGKVVPVIGGVPSAATRPGQNVLVVDQHATRHGFIGLTIGGDFRFDTIVSQGCRPIGPKMVITKSKGNLLMQLGGKPALKVVQDLVNELPKEDRQLIGQGLFLGSAVDEYKEHLGRGDFLIRQIVGADEQSGSVAIGDTIRPGRTVQLQIRDATTATEDLELLLDGQQLHGAPAGGLLINCNGRGSRLFESHSHDARAIQRAFSKSSDGAQAAKPGENIEPGVPAAVPLAGMFAAGEIGPVSGESHLHGHTACLGLFRPASSAETPGG